MGIYFVELYDVGMSHHFQDVDFPRYSFHIASVLDLVFFQNFDCDVLSCKSVGSHADFSERALSQRLAWLALES